VKNQASLLYMVLTSGRELVTVEWKRSTPIAVKESKRSLHNLCNMYAALWISFKGRVT